MVELVKGKKYKITNIHPKEQYYYLLGKVGVFADKDDDKCSFYFNESYRTLDDGFEVEEVKELPTPEAEAYTMPDIHEAAGFTLETKMFNLPHNGHLTKQTEVPRETPRQFESGAVRDSNAGKPRPDLISPYFLESLGNVLAKGAIKYGDRNWEKGMPQETFKESAARHYVAWMMNKEDEDHAAQLAFNIMAWIHFRDKDNAKS